MEWSGQGLETAIVGYNSNGDYYHNNLANGLPDIAQIISCVIPEGGRRRRQIGQNGGQASRLYSNLAMTGSLETCIAIAYADDNMSFMNFTQLMQRNRRDFDRLPKCPLTKTRLDKSGIFGIFDPQPGDCHRSCVMTTNTSGDDGRISFVTVCCYDDNG